MKKEMSEHARAAKAIRAILKKNGVKGKVGSSTYAGGTSVYVDLVNPTNEQYELINTEANKFQYGHFDGMTDSYNYTNCSEDIPQVRFVLVQVEYTEDVQQRAWDVVRAKFYQMDESPVNVNDSYRWSHPDSGETCQQLIRSAMAGNFGPFTI